ncbi:hypothetical protein TNCV_2081151 [Trichonephila clavipes]|nr:hypothetical protein TNCV_2081151 [Trichonephila clavipes]
MVSRSVTHSKYLVLGWYETDHPTSQSSTVDEVRDRLEAAWNELPIFVIQVQFEFMHNRVRSLLIAWGGGCFNEFRTSVNP